MSKQTGLLIIFFMPFIYGMVLSIFRDNPMNIEAIVIPNTVMLALFFLFAKLR